MAPLYYCRTAFSGTNGPFTPDALIEFAKNGGLHPTDHVRDSRSQWWFQADQLDWLFPAVPVKTVPAIPATMWLRLLNGLRAAIASLQRDLAAAARDQAVRRPLWAGAAVSLWLVWLVTMGYEPRTQPVFFHYPSLVGAAFLTVRLSSSRWSRLHDGRHARKAAWAAAFAIAWIWAQYDTYQSYWSDGETDFTETRYRWGDEQIYRRISDTKGDVVWDAQGPMAGTGKPHGHWEYTDWKPYRKSHKWFWYGDSISEGEWHLRNR